jgi:hypothetical protein
VLKRAYKQRTPRGQPVMRHRVVDLLGRIEKSVMPATSGGASGAAPGSGRL